MLAYLPSYLEEYGYGVPRSERAELPLARPTNTHLSVGDHRVLHLSTSAATENAFDFQPIPCLDLK